MIRGQQFSLFGSAFQQQDIFLVFEADSDQLPLLARHIHLCFQARKSGDSHLTPYLDCIYYSCDAHAMPSAMVLMHLQLAEGPVFK